MPALVWLGRRSLRSLSSMTGRWLPKLCFVAIVEALSDVPKREARGDGQSLVAMVDWVSLRGKPIDQRRVAREDWESERARVPTVLADVERLSVPSRGCECEVESRGCMGNDAKGPVQ